MAVLSSAKLRYALLCWDITLLFFTSLSCTILNFTQLRSAVLFLDVTLLDQAMLYIAPLISSKLRYTDPYLDVTLLYYTAQGSATLHYTLHFKTCIILILLP